MCEGRGEGKGRERGEGRGEGGRGERRGEGRGKQDVGKRSIGIEGELPTSSVSFTHHKIHMYQITEVHFTTTTTRRALYPALCGWGPSQHSASCILSDSIIAMETATITQTSNIVQLVVYAS